MGKHRAGGNGDKTPDATPGKLLSILGRANSEKTQQAAFWRTHSAIQRAIAARVRKQQGR